MATVATPVLAGGARRGAAPTVSRQQAQGTTALTADEELINQLLGSFAAAQSAAPIATTGGNALQSLAEAIGSGSNVIDLGGSSGGGDSMGAPGTGATGGISPSGVNAVGTGLSALGAIMGNQDMAQMGQALGLGGAVAGAQSPSQTAGILGGAALSAAGVPGVGLASNAIQGNVPGMINSALALASPQIAAINALVGLVTGQTLGSLLGGSDSSSTPGLSDVESGTGLTGFGLSDVNHGPVDTGAPDAGTTGAMQGGFGETAAPGADTGSSGAFGGGFGTGDTSDGGLGGTEGSGNSGGDNGADSGGDE